MIYSYLFFLAALILGTGFTWLVRAYALRMNIVNKPNPIVPQHVKPIAYLGGVGIIIGAIVMVMCSYRFDIPFQKLYRPFPQILPMILGVVGFACWGVFDDLKQLKPLPKFAGQLALAIACVGMGLQVTIFHQPVADVVCSVFWIVLVVNALNFTDVCDGLVGTVCVASFFTIGLLVPELRIFSFLVAGATAGFLVFNWPSASIFLGDAGSHLLGFLLAATGIVGSRHFAIITDAVVWMALIASVPLFELIFITTIRIHKGLPWWKGSPDHFSLRLQQGGFSKIQINAMAAAVSTAVVCIACFWRVMPLLVQATALLAVFLFYAIAWRYLLRWEVKR